MIVKISSHSYDVAGRSALPIALFYTSRELILGSFQVFGVQVKACVLKLWIEGLGWKRNALARFQRLLPNAARNIAFENLCQTERH